MGINLLKMVTLGCEVLLGLGEQWRSFWPIVQKG
jgi:hypothetical protein